MTDISQRLQRLHPSATRAISEKATALRKTGIDVLSLSTGESNFISPPAAFDYARKAMQAGKTFYTATAGIPELRQAVAAYYMQRFNIDYKPDDVIIGAGAKPLLFEALATLVDLGDEVILTAPAWVSYVEQIKFLDAIPIILETHPETLDINIDAIRSAITPRTKAFILNSPHNPSGIIFDQDSVATLCSLATAHDFTIINDEVYERIVFDGNCYRNPLCYAPDAYDHVLNINAVSKTYAMTGWRIGFATGPSHIIKQLIKLQSHLTSGASSIAQWAGLGALLEAQEDVDNMSARYQKRKDLITQQLDDMPYLRYIPPHGAFYIFADIRATIGKTIADKTIIDDISFCQILLEQNHLALVPGSAFLQPGYVRLSFATSSDIINRAMSRLHNFLGMLTD